MTVMYLPAISCPALNVSSAVVDTTDRTYQTSVNVSCISGYQMNNSQYGMVVKCQVNKAWFPQPVDCKGNIQHFRSS